MNQENMKSQMDSPGPVDLDFLDDKKNLLLNQNQPDTKDILETNQIKIENGTDINNLKVEVKTEYNSDSDTEFIDNLKSDIPECYDVTKIEQNELHIKPEEEDILPDDEVNRNHRCHKRSKGQCSCENVDKLKSCSICKKKFTTTTGLKVHLLVHKKNYKFKCVACDKGFTQKSGLKRHMNNHDKLHNKSKCDLCGTYVVDLNRHQLVHNGRKDFICQRCGKIFGYYHNLKAHLLRHGDEVFTCFECNRRFNDKANLKKHIVTHGNNRRFKCSVCDKSFFFNKHLRQHLLTHTGEKNFKCNICEKTFSQHGHLKTHLITHTDERNFKCDLCDVTFRYSSSMRKHMKCHCTKKKKRGRVGRSTDIEIVK